MNKKHRFTVYAESGRVSMKTIHKIIIEHIISGNKYHAQKAIQEFIDENEHIYNRNKKIIDELKKVIGD